MQFLKWSPAKELPRRIWLEVTAKWKGEKIMEIFGLYFVTWFPKFHQSFSLWTLLAKDLWECSLYWLFLPLSTLLLLSLEDNLIGLQFRLLLCYFLFFLLLGLLKNSTISTICSLSLFRASIKPWSQMLFEVLRKTNVATSTWKRKIGAAQNQTSFKIHTVWSLLKKGHA